MVRKGENPLYFYIRIEDSSGMEGSKHLVIVLISALFLFASITLMSYLLFYSLGMKLSTDDNVYYWTLSSIFQGLFSILAFAGIYIIFKLGQLNLAIDKFNGDILLNLPRLKRYFKGDEGYCSYHEIELYLDKRQMSEFKRCLDKMSRNSLNYPVL